MAPLLTYFQSLTPGFLVFAGLLVVVPRSLTLMRILLHIAFFVLARDAMTRSGFWQIGPGSLRFTASSVTLLMLACVSIALFMGVFGLERGARAGMRWCGMSLPASLATGIAGALLITGIAAALKAAFVLPSLARPAADLWPVLLVFALAGNAYEELLFRGMLQNHLGATMTARRAALLSGLFFCLCHAYLATTVTTVTTIGAPVLLFTLLEGLVAAFIYIRAGLLGAALAHGLAIALLASGVY